MYFETKMTDLFPKKTFFMQNLLGGNDNPFRKIMDECTSEGRFKRISKSDNPPKKRPSSRNYHQSEYHYRRHSEY